MTLPARICAATSSKCSSSGIAPRLTANVSWRRIEAWTAAEDRARLEAELLHEYLAPCAVHLERVGLTAGAVEREHQLRPQPLAQRVRAYERLEVADEGRVLADREPRLGLLLEEDEPELLEPRDLLLRERLVAELRERLAAPEAERLVEQLRAPRRLARARLVDERTHARGVELVRFEPDDITGRPRLDHVRPERLPQLRDEILERRDRRCGRIAAPQHLDEPVDRHDPARVEEERREQRALLGPAERDRFSFCARFERAEDGEIDHAGRF